MNWIALPISEIIPALPSGVPSDAAASLPFASTRPPLETSIRLPAATVSAPSPVTGVPTPDTRSDDSVTLPPLTQALL
jgi:hypothetical protein